MKIEVIGSGCATCKKLFTLTERAVLELGLKTEVEYIPDINRIVSLGLMQSPVILIDGKVALVGFTPDVEKIKTIITDHS